MVKNKADIINLVRNSGINKTSRASSDFYNTASPDGSFATDYGNDIYTDPDMFGSLIDEYKDNLPEEEQPVQEDNSSFVGDLVDTARKLTQEVWRNAFEADLGKVEKESSELEAIDVLDNYKKTVDEYNKVIVEYESVSKQRLTGASIEQIQQYEDRLQQLRSKIADLDSRIDMYDEWIRTKGIYTEAIANQMFDTSKLSMEEYMNVVNRGTYGKSGLAGTAKRLRDDWKEITNGENYKASDLLSPTAWLRGAGKAIGYAGDVITAIGEGAMGFLYNYTPHTADSRKVDFILSKDEQKDVASPETQKYIDYLVNKMYKGRNLSGRKLTSKERENVIHLNGDFTDPDKIKEWKDEHRERIKELTEELNMDRNAIHQGRFKMFVGPMSFVPDFMNPTIKWYNPEDISEAYNAGYDEYNSDKQATEENEGWLSGLIESTVKHPLYATVGTGSTISLFKNQLYAMGISQGFAALLSFIATKNPALAMSAKFAQAAKYAQNIVSVGAGVAGAYNSRIEETGMEKLQAIQEKLYDDLIKRGVNYGQLLSNIKTKLTNDFKLDVSDYNDQELLEAAISYNLTDIVPGLKDSQKGIEKLVNANNALAVKDYLETLPFMKFEGSFLKNTLSKGREAVSKAASAGRAGVSKIPYSNKFLSIYDKTKAAVGAYKNKVFDKFISHDADFIRSANGRMLAYAGRKAKGAAKILAYEGVLEGGEEGVQTILSKNFRNGLYDDSTNKQESMFDLNELLNLPGLYSRAYLDYFGLNDDDPYNADPELRKAMNIGYASSIMFSGLIGAAHSASTNIRNNPYDDNLRQLRQQIKSDRIVDDIISSYAKRAQDHDHIGIYFDRFKENNKSIVSLIRSLNDMKDNLPADSLISKEDLDADIRLANNTYNIFNSEYINKHLEQKGIFKTKNKGGIKFGSDQHKQIVIDGATAITDLEMTADLIESQRKKFANMSEEFDKTVEALTSDQTSEEEKEALRKKNPGLAAALDIISEKFEKDRPNLKKYYQQKFDEADTLYSEENPDKNSATDTTKRRRAFVNRYWDYIKDGVNGLSKEQVLEQVDAHYGQEGLGEGEFAINPLWDSLRETFFEKEEIYRNNILAGVFRLINKRARKDLHEKLSDVNQRNLFIKKETGLDINLDRLNGLVDEIGRLVEEDERHSKKIYDKYGTTEDELFDEFINNITSDYTNKEDSKNSEQFGDVISNLVKSLTLNNASYILQSQVAKIYTGTPIDVDKVRNIVWGDKKTSVDDFVDQQKKISEQINKRGELESDVSNLDIMALTREFTRISDKASWAMILEREKDHEQRRLIARRRWEEEDSEAITGEQPSTESTASEQSQEDEEVQTGRSKVSTGRSSSDNALDTAITGGKKFRAGVDTDSIRQQAEERKKQTAEQEQTSEEKEKGTNESKTPSEGLTKQGESPSVKAQDDKESTPVPRENSPVEGEAEQEPESTPQTPTPVESGTESTTNTETPPAEKAEPIDDTEDETTVDDSFDEEQSNVDDSFDEEPVIDDDFEEEPSDVLGEQEDYEQSMSLADAGAIEWEDDIEWDDEDQTYRVHGEPLSHEESEKLEDELLLLGMVETTGVSQEYLPDGTLVTREQKRVLIDKNSIGDLVSRTCFYQPDATEPVKLTVNGQEIKFDKPVRPGSELAQRLTEKDFLKNAKKYYVVSQASAEIVSEDPRDAMTISLVIESDDAVYITVLRGLGKTKSEYKHKRKQSIAKNEEDGDLYLRYWESVNVVDGFVTTDKEADLVQWLEMLNLDMDKIERLYEQMFGGQALDMSKEKTRRFAYTSVLMQLAKNNFINWSMSVKSPFTEAVYNRTHNESEEAGRKAAEKLWYSKLKGEGSDKTYVDTKKSFLEQARQSLAIPGKRVLTTGQIKTQIAKLRENRNAIIDAYTKLAGTDKEGNVVLPTTPIKDIHPTNVNLSNGRFDVMPNNPDGTPRFRGILETSKGDVSIDEYNEKVKSGEVVLGYGTGVFGHNQYEIKALNGEQSVFNGRGLSGKIFYMVKSQSNPDVAVPMMLSEEKFDTQLGRDGSVHYAAANDLTLELELDEYGHAKVKDGSTRQPSAAEVLLYMLCRKFDFKSSEEGVAEEITEFFIHSGSETLLKNQSKLYKNPIGPFMSKQLCYNPGNNTLTIALPTGLYLSNGVEVYSAQDYNVDLIMSDEQLRMMCVNAIATQMHWNTDKDFMKSNLSMNVTDSALGGYLNALLQENAQDLTGLSPQQMLNTKLSILECDQLSFRIGDFFEYKNGRFVSRQNKVSVMAWMLANKKLKTDVSEKLFRDPFVFADYNSTDATSTTTQAVTNEQAKPKSTKTEEKKKQKEETPKKAPVNNEPLIQGGVYRLYDKDAADQLAKLKGITIAETDEERKKLAESHKNESLTVWENDHGRLEGVFVITPKDMTQDEVIDDFIKRYKDSTGKELKKESFEIVNTIKKPWAKNTSWVKVFVSERGDVKFMISPGKGNNSLRYYHQKFSTREFEKHLGGVYSTTRSSQKMNEDKAVNYLVEKLGIDKSNVIVTNAIMKSVADEEIFGMVDLCHDSLLGGLTGYITLSRHGGMGVTYHEAWHYVNLLLHDKDTRLAIYTDYLKHHKELKRKGVKVREVEEHLAEEFRKYVEERDDTSLRGRVKLMFHNIIDFINALLNRKQYRKFFKDIQSGKYGKQKLNRQSVMEFKKQFPKGAYSLNYALPGMSFKNTQEIKGLYSYRDYYDAVRSVENSIISTMDIHSIDDLIAYTEDSKETDRFGEVLQRIQEIKESLDVDMDALKIAILDTLLNNKPLVKKLFKESLLELGVQTKFVSLKNEKESQTSGETETEVENEDATVKEDQPDNVWDQVKLTVSGKENAAVETKLFFRSIPKLASEIVDGKVQFVEDFDDYGVQKLWSFDETWSNVSPVFAPCTSFSELEADGVTYKETSMMGLAQRMKDVSPFWRSVYTMLLNINDDTYYTKLKSQLFTTMCNAKNPIRYIKISDLVYKDQFDPDMDEMDIYDDDDDSFRGPTYESDQLLKSRERRWENVGDEAIKVFRSVSRRWSQQLASRGLVSYNPDSKKNILNEEYITQIIIPRWTNICKTLKLNTSKLTEGICSDLLYKGVDGNESLVNQFLDFFTQLGIPADVGVVNGFFLAISREEEGSDSATKRVKGLIKAVNSTAQGSFGDIVNMLKLSIGKEELQNTGRSTEVRQFDEVFNDYKVTSQVAKLAIIYHEHHPSAQDMSQEGPNGEKYYPITQNNSLSSALRQLNSNEGNVIQGLRLSPYNEYSIILNAAEAVNPQDEKTKLRLNTFVGMKDVNKQKGGDFLEMNALDDYLSKMFMTENGEMTFPTMADKKTWYSLTSEYIKNAMCHETLLFDIPQNFINTAVTNLYNQHLVDIGEIANTDKDTVTAYKNSKRTGWDDYRNGRKKWYEDITNRASKEDQDAIEQLADIRKVAYELLSATGAKLAQFSSPTLQKFSNYFISELDAVISYYNRENIKSVVEDPNKAKDNYHGNIEQVDVDGNKQSRMLFGGNGGLFRYFFDVINTDMNGTTVNLNQKLEALWNLQYAIELGTVTDENSKNDLFKVVGLKNIREYDKEGNPLELDGFELIRQELQNIRKRYVSMFDVVGTPKLNSAINEWLLNAVEFEMEQVCGRNPNIQLGYKNDDGLYVPTSVPVQFLYKYNDDYYKNYGIVVDSPYAGKASTLTDSVFRSVIANNVLNLMISQIEIEKIFTGDPALYKYKANKADKLTPVTIDHTIHTDEGNSVQILHKTTVMNLGDMFSDKIKRLGGTLSPGQEVRIDFTESEKEEFGYELGCSKYTVLNVNDIEVPSAYYDETRDRFKRQLLIDHLKQYVATHKGEIPSWYKAPLNSLNENLKKKNADVKNYKEIKDDFNAQVEFLYSNKKYWKNVEKAYDDYLSKHERERDVYESMLESQMAPYKQITVSDALVFIRPAMYRRIKFGLGEWSTEADENGYSDEIAYQLMENGIYKGKEVAPGAWMTDPKLNKIVKKFQTNILKMSYFKNSTDHTSQDLETSSYNNAIYNKMALMPLFKYHASTGIGQKLYQRMNMPGNELDMIAFKSAVKVGGKKYAPNVVEKFKIKQDAAKEGITQDKLDNAVSSIDSSLTKLSDVSIDYASGLENRAEDPSNTLAVSVQDIKDLRLQLNTHAHEHFDRSMGTQMAKLAFSNVIDAAMYGNKTGRDIKHDINTMIEALREKGVVAIRDRFYKEVTDPKTKETKRVIDTSKVADFIKEVAESQGFGTNADDILRQSNCLESLTNRTVFEQAMSKLVNKNVVDIVTNGGTAVQQSVYTFAGSNVQTQGFEGYRSFNNGKELKWITKDNSMEVLLSMNFFKPVVPKEHLGSYEEMRQWLIDNDVIKGTKNDGKESNPKPFGIGYRIPTQGMSSMFSFVVADVLPENAGDTIVVPREFTAQTGSDFDIDKLYLATYTYANGIREEIKFKKNKNGVDVLDTKESTIGAIGNRLLDDYHDIITADRNFANARASIDVITAQIQDEVLPVIRTSTKGYRVGYSMLAPSFQTMRKQEFSVGKTGIGPFALNVTNMALTQFVHLTFDYGVNEYGFLGLDSIEGKDGLRIADWLSAMVNAHVDVAKDAYVFDLNVNNETYNHTNFLLRAGMGKATFFMLANPAVKEYVNKILGGKGIYASFEQEEDREKTFGKKEYNIRDGIIKKILNQINEQLQILEQNNELKDGKLVDNEKDSYYVNQKILDNIIPYYTRIITPTAQQSEEIRKATKRLEEKNIMFSTNTKRAEDAIRYANSADPRTKIDSLVFQLYALEAYFDVKPYADAISELVQASKIDTKKFGNNICSHFNFENNLKDFQNNSSMWTLNLSKKGMEAFYSQLPEEANVRDKAGNITGYKPAVVSQYALKRYFEDTFLQNKFNSAQKYTRMLLWGQSYKASPVFKDIFFSMARNIFGPSDSTGPDGKVYNGYKKVYNDDTIQAYGNGIEAIMRFNALMKYGPQALENEHKHGNDDAIDFAMNGDRNAVMQKVQDLIFGQYELNESTGSYNLVKPNIFERLQNLLDEIKNDPSNERFSYLVDEDGNILNEMLTFLTPLQATANYPIGRILCAEPTTFTKGERRNRLTAAFSELLSNEDDEIRELARDVAFYAYYSTYDQGGRNAFFEFVAPRYRAQYDIALRNSTYALSKTDDESKKQFLSSIGQFELLDDMSLDQCTSKAVDNLLDVLCRNYWYDNNFIRPYRIPNQSYSNFQSHNATVYSYPVQLENTITNKSQIFPTFIASAAQGNPLYIKISKGGETMLYRRTGKISQVAEKQDGGKKYGEIFGVYTAINKAGMHAGKVNIFELCCGYEQTSMFGENRLNRAFAEDTVREEVEKLVQKEHEKFISEDSKLEWDVELEWDTEQPSKAHVSTNDDTYVDSSGSASIGERGFSVEAKNDAKYNANNTVNKNADIIIDINMGEKEFGNNIWHHEEGESEEESAKHKYDEKTVSLNLLKDSPEKIASVFGELAEKVTDDSLLVAVSTRYTQSALRSAVATSSYFTKYKKKHLSEYKKMLKTEDKTSADALYNLHIQELDNREDAYYELLDKATNDFLVEKLTPTIDQLIDSYNITRLISSVGYYSNYMGDVMIDIYANVLSKRGVSLGLSIDSSMYYKYSGTAVSALKKLSKLKRALYSKLSQYEFVKNEESQSNESVESIVETNTTEEIDDIETTATDETQQTEQAAEQIAAEVLKSVEESGTNTTPPDNTIAKETEDGEHKNEECGSAPAKRNRFMSKENFDDDMLD